MMVTWVRGHFKNVKGTMEFDPDDPSHSSVNLVIDANQLWTGEPARDAHLKSADFLDMANLPGDQSPVLDSWPPRASTASTSM